MSRIVGSSTCTKPLKYDIDVAVQCRYFFEGGADLLGELLPFGSTHLPVGKVVFIPQQQDFDVGVGILPYALHPISHISERPLSGDVVYDDSSHCIAVVPKPINIRYERVTDWYFSWPAT